MDSNGLSSTFASVILNQQAMNTVTVKDDLNPIYGQTLATNTFEICGEPEDVRLNPPKFIVEVFHQESGFGGPKYIGRWVHCGPK